MHFFAYIFDNIFLTKKRLVSNITVSLQVTTDSDGNAVVTPSLTDVDSITVTNPTDDQITIADVVLHICECKQKGIIIFYQQ